MSNQEMLTEDVIKEYLNESRELLDLSEYSAITDDAAALLSKQTCDMVLLSGLSSISDAAARSLGELRGTWLAMNRVTEISDFSAECLSRTDDALELTGLKNLSEPAAIALANHQGPLFLSGLTNISDSMALSFGNHSGKLDLSGLKSLSDEAATALAQHDGELFLGGSTHLSGEAARTLANNQHVRIENADRLPVSIAAIFKSHISTTANERISTKRFNVNIYQFYEMEESESEGTIIRLGKERVSTVMAENEKSAAAKAWIERVGNFWSDFFEKGSDLNTDTSFLTSEKVIQNELIRCPMCSKEAVGFLLKNDADAWFIGVDPHEQGD